MKKSCPELPLGRHVRDVHGSKFRQIKFHILDRMHPSTWGGDWNIILLQHETRWIATLNATSPPGLNDMVNIKIFSLSIVIWCTHYYYNDICFFQ